MHRERTKETEPIGLEWPNPADGSQLTAVEKFKKEALALEAAEVVPMHLDLDLLYANVSLGERGLRQVAAKFLKMPDVPADYFERLRGLLLATYFQADLAKRTTAGKVAAEHDLGELRELRMILKTSLEACATKRLFTDQETRELKEIARGTGSLDAAQDCTRYAAFFRNHLEIIKNKTPVEPNDLTRAEELGQKVQDHLSAGGTLRATATDDLKNALDLRDRFYTLLVRVHSLGENAAPFLFGKNYKDSVPSIQSRRGLALLNRPKKPKGQAATPESDESVAD